MNRWFTPDHENRQSIALSKNQQQLAVILGRVAERGGKTDRPRVCRNDTFVGSRSSDPGGDGGEQARQRHRPALRPERLRLGRSEGDLQEASAARRAPQRLVEDETELGESAVEGAETRGRGSDLAPLTHNLQRYFALANPTLQPA